MANRTLTVDLITKSALAILTNELGVLSTLYRDPESEFNNSVNGFEPGDTVSLRRPADFTVRTGATRSDQDVIEGKVPLVVDTQKGIDFNFSSKDLTLNISNFSERFIKPAMINLVNDIASDVFTKFYRTTYNWAGTPGQRVDSFQDFSKGPERLDEMAVPTDMRHGLLSPNDYWGVVGSNAAFQVDDVARPTIRQGRLGMLGNVDTWMSQVTPTHTVGVATGTPLVNGADQNVTYDTAKDTWTQSLVTDGWTNSTTGILLAGDVFTIDGVFMVNPKTRTTTGILQQFTVIADADSGASTGPATLTISPPIIASGPHQTVTAAPADNAAITVMGSGGASYKQNLCYHKNSMALAMVPMELPEGAVNPHRETKDGISVRVIPTYDGTNDKGFWRLDVLYGVKHVDPRLSMRLSGTA